MIFLRFKCGKIYHLNDLGRYRLVMLNTVILFFMQPVFRTPFILQIWNSALIKQKTLFSLFPKILATTIFVSVCMNLITLVTSYVSHHRVLYFHDWLISISIVSLRFIYVLACVIAFLLGLNNNIFVYICI